jgi:hypothetical protein
MKNKTIIKLAALRCWLARLVMPAAPTPPPPRIKRDDEWEMEIILSDGQIVTRTLGGKKTYEAAWEYGESITTPHGHQLIGIRRA